MAGRESGTCAGRPSTREELGLAGDRNKATRTGLAWTVEERGICGDWRRRLPCLLAVSRTSGWMRNQSQFTKDTLVQSVA